MGLAPYEHMLSEKTDAEAKNLCGPQSVTQPQVGHHGAP